MHIQCLPEDKSLDVNLENIHLIEMQFVNFSAVS